MAKMTTALDESGQAVMRDFFTFCGSLVSKNTGANMWHMAKAYRLDALSVKYRDESRRTVWTKERVKLLKMLMREGLSHEAISMILGNSVRSIASAIQAYVSESKQYNSYTMKLVTNERKRKKEAQAIGQV